ncbi:MAG: hypothetical protein HC844_21315 [Tabrizicola sp.]|nr:hypothetical protein [Tabrizicola sp.]
MVADSDGAHGLDVTAGAPLMEVRREARDVTDRVTELRRSVYAMEGMSYAVELS